MAFECKLQVKCLSAMPMISLVAVVIEYPYRTDGHLSAWQSSSAIGHQFSQFRNSPIRVNKLQRVLTMHFNTVRHILEPRTFPNTSSQKTNETRSFAVRCTAMAAKISQLYEITERVIPWGASDKEEKTIVVGSLFTRHANQNKNLFAQLEFQFDLSETTENRKPKFSFVSKFGDFVRVCACVCATLRCECTLARLPHHTTSFAGLMIAFREVETTKEQNKKTVSNRSYVCFGCARLACTVGSKDNV